MAVLNRPHPPFATAWPNTAAPRHQRPRLTARELARMYDAYLSALWRGDDVDAVVAWLDAHWHEPAPEVPRRAPDAVSCLDGPRCRAGVRWYRRGSLLLGYLPGAAPGCYRVSMWDDLPDLGQGVGTERARG